MSAFAVALKEEIRRVSRKEVKSQTGATVQAVGRYRREIAALKRSLKLLERKLSFLENQERKRLDGPQPSALAEDAQRFSARSVRAQRRRVGLSAADYAKLIGVTPLTIYNWEHGKTRPRAEQFAALVAVRGIGKREALSKLELVATPAANGKARPAKSKSRSRRAG